MSKRLLATLTLVVLAACGGDRSARTSGDTGAGAAAGGASGSAGLTGAGATFPYPIYSKWFSEYATKTGIKINYQSIGSGGGIRQLSEQTVDFGASDSPMSDAELANAKGGPVLHFPTVLGAVVVTYNLPGVSTPLRLTGDAIANIFLGKISKWNDARIASLNAGVTLPARDILVVHRSDGSGTTYIFTDYLWSVSPGWKSGPGRGKEVQWPVGLGGKGNEGVAGQVKQTPGTIGYVELAYANQNKLPAAQVKNASGSFVAPTVESITAAAAGAVEKLPESTDYRISVVNAPGANAYPISSFTWLLVYQNQKDAAKAQKLKDFMRWMYTEGEGMASSLDYAPLPQQLDQRLIQRLDQIRAGAAAS